MILRIVKLHFTPEHIETFKEIFESSKPKILAQEGCSHVELWQATADPCLFFTYSHWESQDHLDAYRQSELFGKVWPRTKSLFAHPPEAWSVEQAG